MKYSDNDIEYLLEHHHICESCLGLISSKFKKGHYDAVDKILKKFKDDIEQVIKKYHPNTAALIDSTKNNIEAFKVCTYDNPITMNRECWANGKIVCWYNSKLFIMKEISIPAGYLFLGANIGPWKTGQLDGDIMALSKETQEKYKNYIKENDNGK